MEADWSVELGENLPVIEIPWEGFIDLRLHPMDVAAVSEAEENSALREALLSFNAPTSAVMTSKCDAWTMASHEIDPYEYEAAEATARAGVACYIDFVLDRKTVFSSFPAHEQWARKAVLELHGTTLPQARIDYVIRPAEVDGNDGFGITLYVSACAESRAAVLPIFHAALEKATTVTIKTAATAGE